MKENISIREACQAAGLAISTVCYWVETRPLLAKRREFKRERIELNTGYFLTLCRKKYEQQQKGRGKLSNIKSPQEIEEALNRLK